MERVIVVISRYHYRLYGRGIEYYNTVQTDIQLDPFIVEAPEHSFKDKVCSFLKGTKKGAKYIETMQRKLISELKNYSRAIFFNVVFYEWNLLNNEIQNMLSEMDARLILVDSIKTMESSKVAYECFCKIFSIEHQDIDYARDNLNLSLQYLFIGTNYNLYDIKNADEKYDVTFVGISNPKRLDYLDDIADFCLKNKLNLFVSGHFWHNNNFINSYIGKLKFKRKHPALCKFVKNQFINPDELANVYNQSKICLNINVDYHASFNTRNFDVMYVGKLLISDRQLLDGLDISPNEDFIMSSNKEEMVSMIDKYIKDNDARIKIAKSGMVKVQNAYLFLNSLHIVLK